jgi:hypothetical protein
MIRNDNKGEKVMDLETKKILMNDCSAMDLDSVGSVLTSENIVSPMNEDGTFDTDSGTHLYDCTDEWFNSLSSEDLTNLFDFVELKNNMVEIIFNDWKTSIWGDWEEANNCYMNLETI